MDKRHKNTNWELPTHPDGRIATWDAVGVAVLMDIRDELQQLNRVFSCTNFQQIPQVLKRISRNTHEAKKLRAKS